MALLPKVKLKALASFPANVYGGTGIDIDKANGNFTVNLDYSEFDTSGSMPPNTYTLVWDPIGDKFALVPPSAVGGITDAPSDGTLYGRKNAAWQAVPTSGGGGGTPGNNNPVMDGVAAPGVAAPYSREDHVHPSDTSRAAASHSHVASNVTDFSEAVDDRVGSLLVAGANITLDYQDAAGTLTINSTATGGGGGGLGGTGTAKQVSFWQDGTTVAGSANLTFDATTGHLKLTDQNSAWTGGGLELNYMGTGNSVLLSAFSSANTLYVTNLAGSPTGVQLGWLLSPYDGSRFSLASGIWTVTAGKLQVGSSAPTTGQLDIITQATGNVGAVIKLMAGQTADGLQVTDSANAVMASIGNTGDVTGKAFRATGTLTIAPPAGNNASLLLNKPASGTANYIYSQTNGSNRWVMTYGDATAEGGGNSGSNFTLYRCDDTGASQNPPVMSINRAVGLVTFSNNVTTGSGLQVSGISAGVSTALTLNKPAGGFSNQIYGNVAGSARWLVMLGDTSAETGSNAGSDFVINRYSDTNVSLGPAMIINRATGAVVFSGTIAMTGVGGLDIGSTTVAGTSYLDLHSSGTSADYDARIACSGGSSTSGQGAIAVTAVSTSVSGTLSVNGTTTSAGAVTAIGYTTRTGTTGAYGGNNFNIAHTTAQQLWIDASNVGTFAYTSDYRIKKDVIDLPGMWDTVKTLRPIKYTQAEFQPPSQQDYITEKLAKALADKAAGAVPQEVNIAPLYPADDIERWGFIAHELQETLVPSAASGEKDSYDTVQSPNPWTVIAALTKALQEAMTRIEALEASP